jgi:hypothetical protein
MTEASLRMTEGFAQDDGEFDEIDDRELSAIAKKSLREKIRVRILRHDLTWHLSCAFVVSGLRDAPLAARDSGGTNAADDLTETG